MKRILSVAAAIAVALSASGAAAGTPASEAPPADAPGDASLTCKSDNECGRAEINGEFKPVKLRTPRKHKLRPCAGDGSHIPKCEQGRCVIVLYKC